MPTNPSRFTRTAVVAFQVAALFAATAAAALPPEGATDQQWQTVRLEKYQLEKQTLGAQGYDPVAYFPEGDPKGKGKATKGSKKTTHTHRGVTYRFSSTKNRELFKKDPGKYEPAYGGWCAYAAAHESYTEPNPKNFRIQNGRLMLFYKDLFSDTNKLWTKEGPAELEPLADRFWKAETGERPPEPDAPAAP
jgi:YHS domain-containing protein